MTVVLIGVILNIVSLLIAFAVFLYGRRDKSVSERDTNKQTDFTLDKRLTVIEKKVENVDKDILGVKEDIKEVKDGFYNEVKEIKADIKNIFNILITMNNHNRQ